MFYRVSNGGSSAYRITITVNAYAVKNGSSRGVQTTTWIYEIHDGVITKISGDTGVSSFQVESAGTINLYAYISSVTIESI